MSHKFSVGDIVKCQRTGLETEVIETEGLVPGLVLCGWFDWREDFQEVYFWTHDLVLLKAAEPAKVDS